MKEDRNTCVLYATATCNLACKYCYIDKSPILKDIDKKLEESFEGNYYFDFMKQMFYQNQLKRIEIWGGEPTYGLKRTLFTILKAMEYFSNLQEFFVSTNLTTPTCIEDIFNFYTIISEKFPNKELNFEIQLSIDGPTEINDFNRGKGTTDKFTKNFCHFITEGKKFLLSHKNVKLKAHFKPTLDGINILNLNSEEKINNYFKFLEQYKLLFDNYVGFVDNFQFFPGIPNTATPSPHTQEEGKAFAKFCKIIRELYEKDPKHFIFYDNVMPFYRPCEYKDFNFLGGYSGCGSGKMVLGLLPNDLVSGCHNGFVDLIHNVKLNATKPSVLETRFFNTQDYENIPLVFPKDKYEIYEQQMSIYYNDEKKFPISEMASLIKTFAEVGQIDSKYKDYKNAIEAAHFIQERTCSCVRDNMNITGSKYLTAAGYIKLFLNGAKEEMEAYDDIFRRK